MILPKNGEGGLKTVCVLMLSEQKGVVGLSIRGKGALGVWEWNPGNGISSYMVQRCCY